MQLQSRALFFWCGGEDDDELRTRPYSDHITKIPPFVKSLIIGEDLDYNICMSEEEIGQSNRSDLRSERGIDANKSLVDELVEAVSSKWEVPAESPKQPVILLMGGLQGSGKTLIIDNLSSRLSMLEISPDEIRHAMFQKIPFSPLLLFIRCTQQEID